MDSIFSARTFDGMSGSDTIAVFPVGPDVSVILTTPILSRSCRYVQNCVCFLAGTPYSSHTMA